MVKAIHWPSGEKRLLVGIPKSADCSFVGARVENTQNQNILGKGVTARGPLDKAVFVCTNAVGQKLQTTGNRQILARGPTANAILYSVKPGVNRVSGTQFIRSSQYEFWVDFVFTPAP